MIMYNFNEHIVKILPNQYGGSEKKKTVILDDGNKYLLKFPDPTREIHRDVSYINNAISEYVGCKIYHSVGIPVQDVIIGSYYDEKTGKEKVACACKDLLLDGYTMHEAELLEMDSLELVGKISSFKVADQLIENLGSCNSDEIRRLYRKQFIIDTLISNKDRHNGNWSVLYDGKEYLPCPIYDCGSSLFPLLSDDEITEQNINVLSLGATSILVDENEKRINYHNYWTSSSIDNMLKEELLKLVGKISISKINGIIDDCPYITDVRKMFYKNFILCNYEKTIIPALERITCVKQEDIELDAAQVYF